MSFSTQFAGIDYAQILIAQWKEIAFSRALHPFNDATEAGTAGLRAPAEVDFKELVVEEHQTRRLLNMVAFSSKIPLLESSLTRIKTFNQLCKEHHNLRFTNVEENLYLNMVNNAAAGGVAATGSARVASDWRLTIGKSQRQLDLESNVNLFLGEMEWLLTNAGTAHSGGASGSPVPMDTMAYSRDHFEEYNIVDIKLNGNSVGVFGDPTIEIYSVQQETKDNRDRGSKGWVAYKGTLMLLQDTIAQMQRAYTGATQDYTLQFYTDQGEEFKFTSGAADFIPAPKFHENDFHIPVSFQGRSPNTSTYVIINTSTKVMELKRV